VRTPEIAQRIARASTYRIQRWNSSSSSGEAEERSTYCPEKLQRIFFETIAQQEKQAKQEATKNKEQ